MKFIQELKSEMKDVNLSKSIIFLLKVLLASLIIYFTTYINIRSEIDATRKDIELLTQKVESVKFEYLKRIEEYKSDLNIKGELEKTLILSKVEAYKTATSLKVAIIKRKNMMGSEKELNDQFFDKVPELLILLGSHVQLRNEFKDELKEIENNYNQIVLYIEQLRNSGAKTYSLNLDGIETALDKIQVKLLK